MGEKEQDAICAQLLLDERRTERKLACLDSRIRQTKEAMQSVFIGLESSQTAMLSRAKEKYASVDVNIAELISEKEETLNHLYKVREEIGAIEGRPPY